MQLQPSPRGDNSTSGMMKAVMFENEKVQIHRYEIVVSNVLSLIISTTSHVIQGETAFVLTTQWSTGICGMVIPCGIQGRSDHWRGLQVQPNKAERFLLISQTRSLQFCK